MRNLWTLHALLLLLLTGCDLIRLTEEMPPEESAETEAEETTPKFVPPSLDELEAKVKWEDRPVVDSLKLLREFQEELPRPRISYDEARQMKNDSAEANALIANVYRLLPADDSKVDYDGTITRYLRGDVGTMTPILTSTAVESDYFGLTGFGLFSFDWRMNPFAAADCVVSWQSSEDRLYDKVVLRDDLTWSDGKPITAHDVEFSYHTIMNPNVPAVAVRSGTDELLGVKAYDVQTVVFFHKKAQAINDWNINFPIIPKHVYEESVKGDPTLTTSSYHVELESDPITGGPYDVKSRTRNQEIVLTRRESWYMHKGKQVRDKPYFKTIRLKIFQTPSTAIIGMMSGELDEMELTPDQWIGQASSDEFYRRNTKLTGPEWTSFHFGWNLNTPFFVDRRVRQAMSYAFDYNEMLNEILQGLYQPAASIYHHDAWMAQADQLTPYHQDLDKAEQLLDEAGWIDSDGDRIRDKEVNGRRIPFQFTMLVGQSPERVRTCELLRFNLEQIGVICDIAVLESTVLFQRTQNKQFEAWHGGWGAGADPYTADNIWKTDADRNYVSYSNAEVDKLFEEGKLNPDREERAKIYSRINRLIYEDQPYTFLFYRNSFFGFDKRLRGWNFSPRGPYHYGPGFGSIWRVAE